ncbi:MAG: hypothetical protein KF729_10745 [Sandaracinaceae bacterium]|nr:hypothetical protein [Sandaracinaceae bacterium]
MTPGLRRQTLERRRALEAPSYRALREDASAHVDARASFEGRVDLVRSAGPRLWIFPMMTRADGERWVDPLYVLAVVEPRLPAGAVARVDGWVVGERRIGQYTLPLIVAYSAEALDAPPQ